MKKLICVFLVLGCGSMQAAFAGSCNNGTLDGRYTFSATSVSFITSKTLAAVGQATFSNGRITSGKSFGTADGLTTGNRFASGSYKVYSTCVANMTIIWDDGSTPTKVRLYLNTMDTAPATNIAYKGVGVAWEAADSLSYVFELVKLEGKF
jgi:hypothetical protein